MGQRTKQWLLNKKPVGTPTFDGSDNATFKLVEKELPDPKDDEVLVKALYLSNDPAQRTWIDPHIHPDRMYVPPLNEGNPMRARGLAEVVESKSSKWKKGQTVIASVNWSEYAVLPAKDLQPADDLPGGMPKTHYLGALGLTGLTAWYGLTKVGDTNDKDVVVVSGAAGATGMMAVQIAKKILGSKKVIGMAGSDEKCKWVESIGADLCLNYKSSTFKEDLAKALPAPDGFADVYFDNVGGEITDLMLGRMARFGRIICCGAISAYNSLDNNTGIKNWFEIIINRLTAKGFIVIDYMDDFPKAREIFRKALEDGKLKIDEGEQVVKTKFEDIPKTWLMLYSGGNTGKLVTALV